MFIHSAGMNEWPQASGIQTPRLRTTLDTVADTMSLSDCRTLASDMHRNALQPSENGEKQASIKAALTGLTTIFVVFAGSHAHAGPEQTGATDFGQMTVSIQAGHEHRTKSCTKVFDVTIKSVELKPVLAIPEGNRHKDFRTGTGYSATLKGITASIEGVRGEIFRTRLHI